MLRAEEWPDASSCSLLDGQVTSRGQARSDLTAREHKMHKNICTLYTVRPYWCNTNSFRSAEMSRCKLRSKRWKLERTRRNMIRFMKRSAARRPGAPPPARAGAYVRLHRRPSPRSSPQSQGSSWISAVFDHNPHVELDCSFGLWSICSFQSRMVPSFVAPCPWLPCGFWVYRATALLKVQFPRCARKRDTDTLAALHPTTSLYMTR